LSNRKRVYNLNGKSRRSPNKKTKIIFGGYYIFTRKKGKTKIAVVKLGKARKIRKKSCHDFLLLQSKQS